MRRSRAYNASTCQLMDGSKQPDGFCYFTATNCSKYYINCQCYLYFTSVYTNATCSNINGTYFNGRCYYNSGFCPYYRFAMQCYDSMSASYRWYTCPGAYDYSTGYCYFNNDESI